MHRVNHRIISAVVVGLSLLLPMVPGSPPLPHLYAQTVNVSSVRGGSWSDPAVWNTGRLPGRGEWVTVSAGHTVTYNAYSEVEVGRLLIRGALVFARDRNTRLDIGNVIVERGGYLEMGTTANPIPGGFTAEIRFVISPSAACTGGERFVERDTGLWVFPGGRWEAHGAPVRVTWAKLSGTAAAGASLVRVVDDTADWEPGSWLVVTPTDGGARRRSDVTEYPQFEEAQLVRATRRTGHTELQLSRPLQFAHDGTPDVAGEVALLTRNIVITSKYADAEVQGHTVFMHDSSGGLSYVEFRQLGNLGCQSRYPVHFHMMEDTSRGLRVHGASIWRSNTNFINIHGSNGITVEDTVGYGGTGIGFFVGEPAEGMASVDSVLVNNLAARVVYREGALHGRHRGAGFWVESLNSALIGNVASGSWGLSTEDAGFHIASNQQVVEGFSTLRMIRNEAHSNNGSGLHTWNNGGPPYAVVDFRGWRNGFAGLKWGAYRNRMQVHRAQLFENGTQNMQTTAISISLTDSVLYGTAAHPTPLGLFVAGYFIANDPSQPSQLSRNTFAGHQVHVSQEHSRCGSAAEERDPLSRACSGSYLLFADNRFTGGTAFDFGWHRNANSWFQIRNWNGTATPPITATNFRLTRRDRPRPSTQAFIYTPSDAWLDPAQSGAGLPAAPPQVTLTGLTDGATLGSSVVFSPAITSPAGIDRVIYYVDERIVATQATGPFRYTWSSAGWRRRYAHVYAAVVDRNGNTGYTQVIRLRR